MSLPKLSLPELSTALARIPAWSVTHLSDSHSKTGNDTQKNTEHNTKNNTEQLQRIFLFPNFKTALHFTNRVADMAEAGNHHPSLLLEWGRVTVCWWTHTVNGLTEQDVLMAEKTDQLFATGTA